MGWALALRAALPGMDIFRLDASRAEDRTRIMSDVSACMGMGVPAACKHPRTWHEQRKNLML